MMKFRVIKDAIKDLLVASAAGEYQVIGFQRQEKTSEEFINKNRLVEVYFRNENFDKSKGRLNGPTNGEVSIAIELTASAASKADLSVIENPNSTEVQLQAAILGMKEASTVADDSMDELADLVYQILMDARNLDLGLPVGTVANRWVSTINKNDPNPRGQLVVLTAFLEFSCDVSEDVLGDTGLPIDTINSEIEIKDDTIQKTGIEIKY